MGKGDQITIRTDPWLSNAYPFSIQLNETIEPNIQMVNRLINSEGSWNEQQIRSIFNEEIAEAILQTPIVKYKDKFIWVLERNKTYSVRSGYEIAFSFFHPPINTLPAHLRIRKLWKSIWSLCAPPKVKSIVWKLTHDGVPVKQKLKSRIARVEDKCPRCNDAVELVQHCFLSCQHSLYCWTRARFST